jgi:hypothetical protein
MITIFGDCDQFSVKKLAIFFKINVQIIFLLKTAVLFVKNAQIFHQFFVGKNIFKIDILTRGHVGCHAHKYVPRLLWTM